MDEHKIVSMVLGMREFQKINCIKNQCISNVLYFIKKLDSSNRIKIKPVIVVSFDDETNIFKIIGGHLIVVLKDGELVIDPSYDVDSLKNKSYFGTIEDFIKGVPSIEESKLKQIIGYFLEFVKIAEQMNNDEFFI
jgi:hypothetical protein